MNHNSAEATRYSLLFNDVQCVCVCAFVFVFVFVCVCLCVCVCVFDTKTISDMFVIPMNNIHRKICTYVCHILCLHILNIKIYIYIHDMI